LSSFNLFKVKIRERRCEIPIWRFVPESDFVP